jgi:hypothetical protein
LNLSEEIDKSTDDVLTDSTDLTDTDQSYDEISNEFLDLYKSTYILEDKNEINIQIGENVQPCVIKFDMKTIDWSKFKEFLNIKINKICKLDATKQFDLIIKVLKSLDIFNSDTDYDIEYAKLNHNSLKIPTLTELKSRYQTIFDTRTWYEILGLKFNYYSLTEFNHLLNTKYIHIKHLSEKIYDKLRLKHSRLPKYPVQYYKSKNINNLNDIFKRDNVMDI